MCDKGQDEPLSMDKWMQTECKIPPLYMQIGTNKNYT
jgi:hypothetical protein